MNLTDYYSDVTSDSDYESQQSNNDEVVESDKKENLNSAEKVKNDESTIKNDKKSNPASEPSLDSKELK